MAKNQPQTYLLYAVLIISVLMLFASVASLINLYELKKALVPKSINIKEFIEKLSSHPEMKNYAGVDPLNILQINNNNYPNLQAQIRGLNVSHIGNFIVQYNDRLVIYDYNNDKITGGADLQQQTQVQLPEDFFTKLNKHSELKDLQNQKPAVAQLDSESLDTLKQQFPQTYAKAKEGDFILRYEKKLVIFDYKQNKIVNVVDLTK
jgi:hypothetical protein